MTEDERQQFVASFLDELEEEHARRETLASAQKQRFGSRRTDEFKREKEEAELKNSLRRKFYEENGYKQSVDRTGRQVWLSPSEFSKHHKVRRKKRKKTRIQPKVPARFRDVLLFVLMCVSAVLIGLMLVR